MPTERRTKRSPRKRGDGSRREPGLEAYREKRDFDETSEPRGRRRPALRDPRFVVQEHDPTSRQRGQYGAGPVIVWDRGTYRNMTEKRGKPVPVEDAIRVGHVTVWLEGEKLAGGFALTRVAKGKRERWLLVKKADEKADRRRKPVRTEPRSVLSGRTVDELS
jgi:ATP-dependent DNA ligase